MSQYFGAKVRKSAEQMKYPQQNAFQCNYSSLFVKHHIIIVDLIIYAMIQS